MATIQGQDIIRCQLCSDSVEFHCIPCREDLCENCVLIHLKDKTKKHQVVEFSSKNESLIFPTCSSHKNSCETYCHDCKKPACIKCLTRSHKDHDFEDIETIIEIQRKQITSDTEEEKNMLKKCQTFKDTINSHENEFDNVISEISLREEKMIESVRQAAEKRRSDVVKKKKEIKAVNVENASKISDAEQQLQQAIKENEEILRSKNVMDFINYRSLRDKFREDLLFQENPHPKFVTGGILDYQILRLLGSLSFEDANQCEDADSTNANRSVLSTFQSPCNKLCTIHCAGNDEIWMGGKSSQIYKMGSTGKILQILDIPHHFSLDVPIVTAFTMDAQRSIFFSLDSSDETVYRYQLGEAQASSYLYVNNWRFKGLCFARNGDLLASMRTKGMKQSKITRFSGVTEVRKIQYDSQWNSFLSTNSNDVLFLTTTSSGDFCVADWAGEAVVAFNDLGELRYRYKGNVSEQTTLKRFKPYDIVADDNQSVLVADTENNLVHIIDHDGNLIRYIEQLSVGGLGIDSNKNLAVGDIETGLIKIIKYSE